MADGSPLAEKPVYVYVAISVSAFAIALGTAAPFGLSMLVLVSFVVNWIFFIPAYILQDEKFFDLVGAITNTFLAVYSLYTSAQSTRSMLCSLLVLLWAGRLGSFLFARVHRDGKDSRFTEIKKDSARFFNVWSLQALWCWFNLYCLAIHNSPSMAEYAALPLNSIDYAGIALWGAGFAVEVMADTQKSAFRADPTNKGKFISSGVWSWSRHPNYCGEIMLWVGLSVICSSAFAAKGFGLHWVGWWSPCFVALLLTKVSGVPMLETKSDQKWGDNPDYKAYKQRTSVLFPGL